MKHDSKRVLAVIGTRPEAIKMAPVIKALTEVTSLVSLKLCVTGQHRQMLDQVLSVFDISPQWDLSVMRPSQGLTDITSAVLAGVRGVLTEWNPQLVLVQGDTTTAFATALAGFYEKVAIGHVEAGLRTGNPYNPWPEEMNRRLISCLATHHFAPTIAARNNLMREGLSSTDILVTGNTVIDALFQVVSQLHTKTELRLAIEKQFAFLDSKRRLIVVTAHRREHFGEAFEAICLALRQLAKRHDVEIVYPVHLNPNVQEPVRRILGNIPNVHLIEPLDYVPFVALLNRSFLVMTDSGGIQEEAPSLGKPVLVLRTTTERPEAVEAGTVRLVGIHTQAIVDEAARLLDDATHYECMQRAHNPYGDGRAAKRIANAIAFNVKENWVGQ